MSKLVRGTMATVTGALSVDRYSRVSYADEHAYDEQTTFELDKGMILLVIGLTGYSWSMISTHVDNELAVLIPDGRVVYCDAEEARGKLERII